MKARFVAPVLVVLFLTPAAFGGEPRGKKKPSTAPSADPKYVDELLSILEETQSVDTFKVTLELLVGGKADPQRTIPVVIRSAERLGIFGRHDLEGGSPEDDLAKAVYRVVCDL